jgi:hypothetical protein
MSFFIGKAVINFDTGIYNGDIVIFGDDFPHLIQWEPFVIDGEVFIVDHIVNVAPDSIQRQIVLFEVLKDILQVGDVFVSPSTLVEPHAPEWRDS